MADTKTTVEILNTSLNKIAEVRALYPLNNRGMVLRYSKELSDYGFATFRVSTKDPILTEFGDILKPHAYHVRIKRGNATVWQGAIVDNSERNKNYVEVRAVEYLFYLDRVLIRRDADKPDTDDDESNFKVYNSGTMAAAVQTIIQNAATDFGTAHILGTMAVGDIENPNYPNNFIDSNNVPLTGAWSFSDDITLTFDYHSALYVLKAFGMYSGADFLLNDDLTFDFKPMIGNRITGLTFNYGTVGTNIIDYNVPRFGQRQANHIIGIAADDEGKILHDFAAGRDNASIATYGLLQQASAYGDVKSKNALAARLSEELRLVTEPEDSPINIVLDEKAYPLGQFGLGDILWVRIKDHGIDFNKERRVVGFTVNVHNTGREIITVQTNKPRDSLVGAS